MHAVSGHTSLHRRMQALVAAAQAESTRTGYASDLRHYRQHGGALPAKARDIARYLTRFAGQLAVSTLRRRLAAIHHWHQQTGHPSPVHAALVRQTLAGIQRLHGQPARQVKALVKADLVTLVRFARQQGGIRASRDAALLLLGFAAALRRCELVALQVRDLQFHTRGLDICIRRSKTDGAGRGATLFIPWGPRSCCPVRALQHWLQIAGLREGCIFRALDRHGHLRAEGLTGQSVALIIKRVATAVWGEEAARDYAGHSLRAGFCTQAALLNWPGHWIRQQSRHQSEATLARYIRPGLETMPRRGVL